MAVVCVQASVKALRPPCGAHGSFSASSILRAKYHNAGHSAHKDHRGCRAKSR